MAEMKIEMRKLSGLVVELHCIYTRELRFRIWLAKNLFRFGAWVMGGRAEIIADRQGTTESPEN